MRSIVLAATLIALTLAVSACGGSGPGNGRLGDPCQLDTDCAGTLMCIEGKCGRAGLDCPAVACSDDNMCEQVACTDGVYQCALYAGRPAWTLDTPYCDDQDLCTRDDLCNDAGTCRGTAIVCDQPEPDRCENDTTLWVYKSEGNCIAGECNYPHESIECPFGCLNGACLDCQPDCSGGRCGPDPVCGRPCGACTGNQACALDGSCVGISLVFMGIPAGDFVMGSPVDEPGRDVYSGDPVDSLDETPHDVSLSRDMMIASSEVTQADFESVMGNNPSFFRACGSNCPVEQVSWHEAALFCNRLSIGAGLASCFVCTGSGPNLDCTLSPDYPVPSDCPGFRLPTEAEWEYAARAGSGNAFSNGAITQTDCSPLDPNLDSLGWYLGNSVASYPGAIPATCAWADITIGTHPVGQKHENTWGLHDTNGNVWEWVLDCQNAYPVDDITAVDPVGPLDCSADQRIYRGGGLGNFASYCRNAERAMRPCDQTKCKDIGFRPIRSLIP